MAQEIKRKATAKSKQRKKMSRGQKALKITLIIMMSLVIVLLLGVMAVYMLINHYTAMPQYVANESTMAFDETLSEEYEETGTDSPQEVVYSIEDVLNQLHNIGQNPDDPDAPDAPNSSILPDSEVMNILLIGIDARADSNGGRSDAMILMSINRKTKQITLTSIMRDIYVAIPGRGNNRINAAHAYGGADLLLQTIKLNLGIQIDYFARVNFFSFVSVIDACGGVDIEVDSQERPYVNRYLVEINRLHGLPTDDSALAEDQLGTLHLNGRQALAYARIRYVGSDYARVQRQREVILAVVEQVRKMSVFELNSFLNVALPQISTNMDQKTLNALVLDVPNLLGYSFQQHRVPADGTGTGVRIDGKSVIAVDLEANRKLLDQIIYGR